MPPVLLGDIVERAPSNRKSPNSNNNLFPTSSADVPTGFPKATHRSESAFARARTKRENTRPTDVPHISNVSNTSNLSSNVEEGPAALPASSATGEGDDWKQTMADENTKKMEEMTDEQREQEKAELISHFGPGIVDLMQKIAERRRSEGLASGQERPKSAMAHSRSTTTESSPSNKPLRKLRFSENPNKVYVYESEPSSPRRVLALPPPTGSDADENIPVISLGEWQKGSGKKSATVKSEERQGEPTADGSTPETIRDRYFPAEPHPSQNPTLAWLMPSTEMLKASPPPDSSPSSIIRYDLQGRVIPDHLKQKLPSHLGLHHHGESPDDAGYTLDDLLLLSRSTLPVQRAAMLFVLGRIVRRLRDGEIDTHEVPHMKDIFQKSLIVGIEAFGDRASTSVRMAGIDVVWHGIAYTPTQPAAPTTALSISRDPKQLETLPISYFLEGSLFNLTRSSPSSSLSTRIFDVLHALVIASPKVASDIINVDDLLNNAVKSVILLESESLGDEKSTISMVYIALLRLLNAIAMTSRSAARALIPDLSDAFLKNLVTLPMEWNERTDFSVFQVATYILDFYSTLGRYGLGAAIVSTGHEVFRNLSSLVTGTQLSPAPTLTPLPLDDARGRNFIEAWLQLHEVWIACAINPHNTTPEHDLLWSHVVAWQWSDALLDLRKRMMDAQGLNENPEQQARLGLWASWWRVWSKWLEGCRINQPDSVDSEIERWIRQFPSSWTDGGTERKLLEDSISQLVLHHDTVTEGHQQCARACHAALLLLIETQKEDILMSLANPISDVMRSVMEETYWRQIRDSCSSEDHDIRQWTNLAIVALRCLHRIDGTKATQATAAAAAAATTTLDTKAILSQEYELLDRLVPGDEMLASELIASILQTTLRPKEFTDLTTLNKEDEIWRESGGPAKILMPLYRYALWPREQRFVGPFVPHPTALKMTTTLLPLSQSPHEPSSDADTTNTGLGSQSSASDAKEASVATATGIELPQRHKGDWIVAPLDVILRSGSTHKRLFKTLPSDWNASETDVVKCLLMLLFRRRVKMCRAQMEFTCMKVFMLEHHDHTVNPNEVVGFAGGEGGEEVYRDPVVGELMTKLLAPFRFGNKHNSGTEKEQGNLSMVASMDPEPTLEDVSRSFLGPSQPFFQFYSDFVGLYDSISFGHPLFATLLLPPTSHQYARDYRRLLWGDHAHMLKSVRTEVEDVLARDEKEVRRSWLEPMECQKGDGEMLGGYVKALVKGQVTGFVRFIAVHQVASCLWPDMMQQQQPRETTGVTAQESNKNPLKLSSSVNLLKALLASADENTLRDLLGYDQIRPKGEEATGVVRLLLLPPQCYHEASTNLQAQRIEWSVSVCGEGARRRFPTLTAPAAPGDGSASWLGFSRDSSLLSL